jgi:methanogenic corrinoid protein MtbC1
VDVERLRDAFLNAQLAGDRRQSIRVMDEGLGSGMSVKDLHLGVIQDAQYQVGRLWERNEITVAREHVASAIAQLALAHLYPHLPRDAANGWRVLLACPTGEQHELPARLASDFMEMAGFEVTFTGADTPESAVLEGLRETDAHVLALSITVTHHWPALERTVHGVKAALPAVRLVVGGRAVREREQSLAELGVLCSAERADVLVERLVAELGEGGRP